MEWVLGTQQQPQSPSEVVEILLANRGITDEELFLHPTHPIELTAAAVGIDPAQLELAIARLRQARDTQEPVVIVGDYDADGISATAILWQSLFACGLNVKPFIPQRDKHGYGLSLAALADVMAAEHPPTLIITVDNGIVAHQPTQWLVDKGVDLIISDHHQPEAELPPAMAIVHTTQLCGATVAWMLARAAVEALKPEYDVAQHLDLAGLATIADQVKLQGANRSFAVHGITALRTTKRVGLLTLLRQAEVDQAEVDTYHLHYVLVPRINAMGRMAHGLDALRLLCTNKADKAEELATILTTTNQSRRELTQDLFDQAVIQAETMADQRLVIVSGDEYHEGVIGLIAGRLVEAYQKPAIAISLGEKTAKASARSIPGVNIVELIREVRSDLLEVGGHPMAAGFGLESTKLELVKSRLQSVAMSLITEDMLVPRLTLDCELPFSLIELPLAEALLTLTPYGQGNPEPTFLLPYLTVLQAKAFGSDGAHLRLTLTSDGVHTIGAVWWRHGELAEELTNKTLDAAVQLEIRSWKQKRSVQLRIKDVRVVPV